MEQKKIVQHNTYLFKHKNEFGYTNEIVFDSNFDSGNCFKVDRVNNYNYIVWTANDCAGNENGESHQKSWFYFSIKGFQAKQTIKLVIKNINMLWTVNKSPELYRPVYKVKNQEWRRLETPVTITTINGEIEVGFDYTFDQDNLIVYFAFSYPYSYQECQAYVTQLFQQYKLDDEIYFYREVLIKSAEGRNIDLITISSQEGKLQESEDCIDKFLFPEVNQVPRAAKFRSNKPVILISSRVHPGETPSSYTMRGILKFLCDKKDARAMLIRKYFVVKLVPMLNPDGVYRGHYRMDVFNQNLNRYYNTPDVEKQPSCYAIRQLIEYFNIDKRLFFYCDLHAHAGKKGCFFYGNAIDDFTMQVESQVFAKILSMNCINFEYDSCNFSKKQMSAKDKLESLTKEGCSRVSAYKQANLIHSYTLECGFHCSNYVQMLDYPSNTHRKFNYKGRAYQYSEDETENNKSELYASGPPFYTIEIYENIGKTLFVSILDIFDKNPYSRISNSSYKMMDGIRKEVALQVAKLDRFKNQEGKLVQKCKKISDFVQELFYSQFEKKKVFCIEEQKFRNSSSKQSNYQNNSIQRREKKSITIDEHLQENNENLKLNNLNEGKCNVNTNCQNGTHSPKNLCSSQAKINNLNINMKPNYVLKIQQQEENKGTENNNPEFTLLQQQIQQNQNQNGTIAATQFNTIQNNNNNNQNISMQSQKLTKKDSLKTFIIKFANQKVNNNFSCNSYNGSNCQQQQQPQYMQQLQLQQPLKPIQQMSIQSTPQQQNNSQMIKQQIMLQQQNPHNLHQQIQQQQQLSQVAAMIINQQQQQEAYAQQQKSKLQQLEEIQEMKLKSKNHLKYIEQFHINSSYDQKSKQRSFIQKKSENGENTEINLNDPVGCSNGEPCKPIAFKEISLMNTSQNKPIMKLPEINTLQQENLKNLNIAKDYASKNFKVQKSSKKQIINNNGNGNKGKHQEKQDNQKHKKNFWKKRSMKFDSIIETKPPTESTQSSNCFSINGSPIFTPNFSPLKLRLYQFIGKITEAPKFIVDNKYIRTGYRINFNSTKQIFKSLFMIHNELVNIWTHYIGALFVILLIVYVTSSFGHFDVASIKNNIISDLNNKLEPVFNEFKEFDQALNRKVCTGIDIIKQECEYLTEGVHRQFTNFISDINHVKENNIDEYIYKLNELPNKVQYYMKSLNKDVFTNTTITQTFFQILNKLDSDQYNWMDLNIKDYIKVDKMSDNTVPRWPILVFLFTATLCLLFSATFHLFYVRSMKVSKIMQRLDYAGISLLISGSTFPLLLYGFYCMKSWAILYLTVTGLACFIVFIVSLQDFIHTSQYFKIKSLMYGCLGIFSGVPIIHLILKEYLTSDDTYSTLPSILFYLGMGVCYLGGLTIYALRCPERFKPGQFDICGHSHQLWHISIIIAIALTYYGAVINFYTRKINKCSA